MFSAVKSVIAFLLAPVVVAGFVSSANATTITPNTSYNLTNPNHDSLGNALNLILSSGGVDRYLLSIYPGGSSSFTVGNFNGSTIDQVIASFNNITGQIVNMQTNQTALTINGGSYHYVANNIVQGNTPGVFADVQGQSSSTNTVINANLSNGALLSLALPTNYMNPIAPIYAPGNAAFPGINVGAYFGNAFAGNLADLMAHGWLIAPSITISGLGTFSVRGDFNLRGTSSVPEPATMGLLGVSLIGGAARRRRAAKKS